MSSRAFLVGLCIASLLTSHLACEAETTPGSSDFEFCRDFIRLPPESQARVMRLKIFGAVRGEPDRERVKRCVSSYGAQQAPALASSCGQDGEFDAGPTLDRIIASGLTICRENPDMYK